MDLRRKVRKVEKRKKELLLVLLLMQWNVSRFRALRMDTKSTKTKNGKSKIIMK